jgi:hypothetical protein
MPADALAGTGSSAHLQPDRAGRKWWILPSDRVISAPLQPAQRDQAHYGRIAPTFRHFRA